MKETLAKLFGELSATRAEEESIVCFLEDVAKLNNVELNRLIKFYRLTVNKGPDFDKLYARVKQRMEELKKLDEQKAKEKQTQLTQDVNAKETVGTENKVPDVQPQQPQRPSV